MTDQMFVFLCKDVRKHAFDFRRGELADAEKRKFTEHVEACEACRDYVNRLEGMLDAAATQSVDHDIDRDALFDRVVAAASETSADDAASIDKDGLFARITSELDAVAEEEDDEAPRVQLEGFDEAPSDQSTGDDGNVVKFPSRGRIALYVAAALAAGVAIGLLVPRFLDEGPQPAQLEEVAENKLDVTGEKEPAPTPQIAKVELTDLYEQPTPAEIDDVKVFGEPKANWQIRTQGARRQIELDSGTVLVEFVPQGGRELEFVSEQFTVRVTGTVFYASAEKGVVGVLTGSVEVDTKDGQTVKLVDGQEWVADEGLRQAPAETTEGARNFVNVEEHNLALKEARASAEIAPEPVDEKPPQRAAAPRPKLSKEVVQTPTAQLRRAADEALKNGRHAVAAQYYERMVEEFSPDDPANATLRLDLARIYMRHLDSPGRASVHLRHFVDNRPDDPAAPSAKKELCRIVSETGQIEPMCDF